MAIMANVSIMMSGLKSDNGKIDLNSLQFITQASAENCEDDERNATGTENCYV